MFVFRCYLQKRILNVSRGPAVRALRAQTDKREYALQMKSVVERQVHIHNLFSIPLSFSVSFFFCTQFCICSIIESFSGGTRAKVLGMENILDQVLTT